jgi:hypothetical protein
VGVVSDGADSTSGSREFLTRTCPHWEQKFASVGFPCEQLGQAGIVIGYSIPTMFKQDALKHRIDKTG